MRKISLLVSMLSVLIFTGAGCVQFGGTPASGPTGVYQSTDKGETWKQTSNLMTPIGIKSISGVGVYRFQTDPEDNNAIYLASRGQGLFYTYDNAQSWQSVDAMAGKFIYGFAVDPQNKCVIYVSEGQHIYKTVDCSRSWQTVYTEERGDQRVVSLVVDFGNSNIVYAAELGGDILASDDAGKGWHVQKRLGFQLQYMTGDKFNPGRLYLAGYSNGLFRSDDNGKDWDDMSAGFDNYTDANKFNRLVFNDAQKDSLFWICKYGILRSDDAGATWTDLKLITPPGSVNIYAFGINPKNQNEMYYTGTILGDQNVNVRSTFYKTTDGGKNWVTKKLPTNTIPVWLLVNPDQDNVVTMGFAVL